MKHIAGLLLSAAALTTCAPVWGWWGNGHGILTRAAVRALPQEVPTFFRRGGETAASVAYDADLFKNRAAPHLRDAEHSEHYFDVELLEGREIPDRRYGFVGLCSKAGLKPEKVGLLPYAVAEWTERLAIAFAEHRRWPDNVPIQQKCLVYAGFIAHYGQDLCQPLHVTVDFDGRRKPDGTVVGKGIHEKVDALVEKIGFAPQDLAREQEVAAFPELMPAILAQLEDSHSLVDRVYELEADMGNTGLATVRAFAEERARRATHFTAALYLTAWEMSAEVELPGWHRR